MSISTLTLNYKSKIAIPFGELQSVLDWCNLNCHGEWNYADDTGMDSPTWLRDSRRDKLDPRYTHILNHLTLDYVFSFESEHDHLAFILVHE